MIPSPAMVTDRLSLERWLRDFDETWQDGQFAQFLTRLPPSGHPLRREALIGLLKLDLKHQWQRGRRPSLEGYLHRCPELGAAADLEAEVIFFEADVRRRHGLPVDPGQINQRFPAQAAKVLALLTTHGQKRADESVLETVAPSQFSPPAHTTRSPEQSSWETVPPTVGPGPAVAPPSIGTDWPSTIAPSDPGALPETFGRFRIVRLLGQGGMGSVYLAREPLLDRDVAIKIPHFTAADGPDALNRFYQEARAAAALHHPNVCTIYEVGSVDGVPYLSMAYVEGRPLSAYVRPGKPWEPRQAAILIRKLASTLHEAHLRGIIHRDLKPSNVLSTSARSRSSWTSAWPGGWTWATNG